MINFLRRIRRNLVTENKITLYLIYAIGEVVLVVFGILIALQIDNWNESRKALKAELQLYNTLLADLNDQFRSTNSEIVNMMTYQDVHYQVYNESVGNAQYEPNQYYNSLQWIFPYHLNLTEKYSESLVIITNSDIRDLLKYYISAEKDTKDAYDEWNEFKVQRLRTFFNKHGIHNTEAFYNDEPYDFMTVNSLELIDHSKLKEQFGTTELDELLFDLRFKTSWIFNNLNWLKDANNKLEQALIKELILNKESESIQTIPRITLSDLLTNDNTIDEIIELIKKDDKNMPRYNVSESEINSFGYNLMNQEKYDDALEIFKLNTDLHPNGYNAFDSYGECLLIVGDTINAIRAYKRSIELYSGNTSAEKVLEKIE